jgi:capsular polysaccharide biosynthesis protein
VELRQYAGVLKDRIAIVVVTFLLALAAAVGSVYLLPQSAGSYTTSLSFAVRPDPLPTSTTSYYSDDYYSYVASEYANDDLIAILQSDTFLQAVRADLANEPGGAPTGSIEAKKAHRVVEITVSAASGTASLAIGRAMATMLAGPNAQAKYFALFTNRNENVTVVDGPRLIAQPAGRNALLNIAARALVGLIAGVGLAFLVEYLDDTMRPNDVRTLLGWPIVGDIPGRGLPGGSGKVHPRT